MILRYLDSVILKAVNLENTIKRYKDSRLNLEYNT